MRVSRDPSDGAFVLHQRPCEGKRDTIPLSPGFTPIGWRWNGPDSGTFLWSCQTHPAPNCESLTFLGLAWADVAEMLLGKHEERRTHTLNTPTFPDPRWMGGYWERSMEEMEAMAALLFNNPDITRHRDRIFDLDTSGGGPL